MYLCVVVKTKSVMINRKRKPIVGETLICVPTDCRNGGPHKVEVTKIGRTYFYTNEDRRYRIVDWRHDNGMYSSDSQLYEDMADYRRFLFARECRMQIKNKLHLLSDSQTIKIFNDIKEMLGDE